MKTGNFSKWLRVAYPKVEFYEQTDGMIYLSDNGRDIQCIIKTKGDQPVYSFPAYTDTRGVTDDYQVVLYSLIVWGTPKSEYRFPLNPGAPVCPPRPLQPRTQANGPTPRAPQRPVTPITLKGSVDREKILGILRGRFTVETRVLPGGAIEAILDGRPGPVLYDYGITPGVGQGAWFAPYSHVADVTKILEKL